MFVEKMNQVADVKKISEAGFDVKMPEQHERGKEVEARPRDGKSEREKEIEVKKAVEKLNKALEIFNVERRFVIDEKTKEVVIKIIDRQTGEVIDQIPPEEALKRYYEMQKFIGLLFNKRV